MPDDLTPKAPIQEKPPTIEQMVKQMNNSFKASEMDAPPVQKAPSRVPTFSQGPEPTDDQLMETLGIQMEKPPERAGGTTFMGKIFDVLSTGEFASAPVVRDYILGKPFNSKNITKGLTHETKYGYGDMTEEMFPEWSPWKRKSLGFLLSIVGDPTTYIPAGIIAKPFKLGYKALKETEIGGKMIEAAGKSKLAKALVPGAGLPKDYYETKYYAKKGLTAEHARIFQDIEELGKGLNADDMKKLTYYREHPDEMKNIPEALKAKLEEIGTRFDALADNAAKEGLITPETAAKWKAADIPYVPHYYPDRPGGVNIVKGQLPPSMFEKIKKPGFVKPRVIKTVEDARVMSGQFEELSKVSNLPEAHKLIEKYGLGKDVASIKEIGLMKSQAAAMAKWYKPEENALKALAYRSMEQANTIARDKFMGDVLTQFGVKVKSTTKIVPEGMGLFYPKGAIRMYAKDVIPADKLEKLMEVEGDLIPAEMLEDLIKTMPSITTRVPKYMLPQSIAADLKGANSFMGADPATQGMLRVFDKITNYWKGMATSVRLPFHLRNMQSNIFQAYLAGVKNPKRFTDALMIQKSFITKGNGVVTLGKKTYTYTELKRMIEDLGVHGKGWMAGDINKSTTDELDAILKYGALRKATPFSVGRMVGTAFEDNARIAVFMDALAKGKSPKDASRMVRKYLFDYTELTDFEKGTMKRIIPFWTWLRKNVPLQAESLVTNPRKYQGYSKALNAARTPETPEEAALKPEYFDKMMYIKTPWKSEKGNPLYMSVDLPANEFNKVVDTGYYFVNSMHPLKAIIEVSANFTTFPKVRPIQKRPLELTEAPTWMAWLPNSVFQTLERRGLVGPMISEKAGDRVLGVDKRFLYAIHSTLPFLGEMDKTVTTPVLLDDEMPKYKKLSYITGTQIQPLDVNKQMVQKVQQQKQTMQNFKETVKQRGQLPTPQMLKKLKAD